MIDAHQHIWRQADLPWLMGPEQPRIFGPYAAIRRDYLVGEYLDDVGSSGITGSVYVQANWAPDQGLAEAEWVQAEADRTGWPHGIVAYADMTAPDVRPALDRLSAVPLVRGIRHQLHWHENALYRFAPRHDLCDDPSVQANIAVLAEFGWTFDLQVFAGQMEGAARLARACPEVTFILQHAGMLEDLSEAGRADWRAGMARLAACPNVVAKLSGLGTFLHGNDAAHIAAVVHETVGMFGAERCLWGSNFPIEKLWTSYGDLIAAHRAATCNLTADQRQAIFNDTAVRVYRLN